jgi:hypothetical protein
VVPKASMDVLTTEIYVYLVSAEIRSADRSVRSVFSILITLSTPAVPLPSTVLYSEKKRKGPMIHIQSIMRYACLLRYVLFIAI